jgi:hypothetical protein
VANPIYVSQSSKSALPIWETQNWLSYAIFLYRLYKPAFAIFGLVTPVVVMHLIHLVCDLMCHFFTIAASAFKFSSPISP